jgi:hypothetical protein
MPIRHLAPSMDNQAPKKEHLMKSGIVRFAYETACLGDRLCSEPASAIDIGISHRKSRQSSSKTGAFDCNSAYAPTTIRCFPLRINIMRGI